MLLGHRIRQQSILWPLVAVMLPGWLLLVSLVRRPDTDLHTSLALRSRVQQQMLAYDHVMGALGEAHASLPSPHATVESIYRQAEQAGLMRDPQKVDAAVVWLHLGDRERAAALLAQIQDPKAVAPYLDIVQKAAQDQPLTAADGEQLGRLLAPDDWWRQTLHPPAAGTPGAEAFARQQRWAWWKLRAADLLLPALGVIAFFLSFSAIALLRGPWTIWPYSERLQRLWPLALMLCVLALRGLFLLLGGKVASLILPLVSWAGQRDVMTAFHIQTCLSFLSNLLVLAATTYGVKECVASHWGSLGDVLGFERREFQDRRLWCVAFPCAVALVYALRPLPALFEGWHLGGPPLFDSLSRSPAGYNALGLVLSVIQAVVFAPFFEEVIYRGFLLSTLRNFKGPAFGAAASSLIYALAHGSSFTGTVTALILGLAYAQMKLHTGRLSAAILLHACVAAIQTSLLWLQAG